MSNTVIGQQPQALPNTPVSSVNAKYVQGVGANPPAILKFTVIRTEGATAVGFPFTATDSGGTGAWSGIFKGTLSNNRNYTYPDFDENIVVGQIASVNSTGLTGNVGITNITSGVTSTWPAGLYRVSCYTVITTAASGGSPSATLPSCNVYFDDSDTNLSQTEIISPSSAANTRGTISQGTYLLNNTPGAISYQTVGYNSSGSTAMVYALHLRLEYLGQ